MQPKYTEEDEKYMHSIYSACQTPEERADAIKVMCEHLDKPKNSITMKLVKMKIYIPNLRVSKVTKDKPQTKVQLVQTLEKESKLPEGELETVQKANKLEILTLINVVKNLQNEINKLKGKE